MASGISVIVCCHNSAQRLDKTLGHLAAQQTQNLAAEIIVVDNASTDGTGYAAKQLWETLGRKDMPLMVVEEPVPGLSLARAKGIAHATYDVLIFCDDDNWLEPGYLQNAYTLMADHPDMGALGGTGLATADVALPVWFEQYKESFACYPQNDQSGELTRPTAFLYGAGLVVRKKVLIKLAQRGFSPILSDRVGKKLSSGGDVELCYAIRLAGYKLWYSEKLKFRHYLPAGRLTEQYLSRLTAAASYSGSQLLVYQYALAGTPITWSAWVKDSIYQCMFAMRALVRYGMGSGTAFEKKMDLLFSWNYMRGVLGARRFYGRQGRQYLTALKGKAYLS
jgi:glycosyltransferase involved in cell wall biosynthesis